MKKTANLEDIKKLRAETSAGVSDVTKALEEASNDLNKARELLKKRGAEIAEKKKERQTFEGIIDSYIHSNGKVGVLLSLLCETDFVARTDDFKSLAHEISMQIAAMEPSNVETLLKQAYIRDNSITIEQLIKQTIGKLGENIKVKEFTRFEL
ncbi:MAG: hypothetical protein ACD_37C00585G0002 [uncultured bacterium]|nr:MAG: hypothetical protein ACD_37C00585G0002 [uncultured bacterium]KKP95905.1 MAG: Elongation factor Ts [Candidatus Levybacteria bacterium GW2011_GWA2_36_13]KKQ57928.1 MAG: elongation factor Ts [Microgenomates group bacterium GW2011_GWC1_38_14]KKR15739.1 MAG: Elongation factor Ts [Candidatus Levybacteria bacterium GW2011_GWA1_39_34]OGH43521.1 MAG: elongation factor Ts [Candidatus Levybacteria bacterium RIFCSPLOWO2_02_FULL_37_11]